MAPRHHGASNNGAGDPHRLVVIGGGVAGLDIATHLAGKRAGPRRLRVTLVDRESGYVWKPMLHTVAAGTSDAAVQQTLFPSQGRAHGFDYQPGEAFAIDRTRREVRLRPLVVDGEEIVPERALLYDTLVLAVGSLADDFGTAGVAEHCASINSRSDALSFNRRFRLRLLKHTVAGTPLVVGIVGGGATGVELAAELIQVADRTEKLGLAGASSCLNVVLIESGARLLPTFPPKISEQVRRKLEQLGVQVRLDTRVTEAGPDHYRLNGTETLPADMKLWAAGVKAPPLLDGLGLERARSGRLVVNDHLRTPADPAIYALGDCASVSLPGRDDAPPPTAQAASQQARYLCRYLPRLLSDQPAPPTRYHDFGSLVSLGGYDAFGALGRFGFLDGFIRGRVAEFGHAMLYRQYQARLHGFWKGSLLWLADIIGRRARRG